jgi:hypothetical protein
MPKQEGTVLRILLRCFTMSCPPVVLVFLVVAVLALDLARAFQTNGCF